MRTIITTICLLTLGSAAAQTTVTGTIQSGGLTRDYRLYVPAMYNGSAAVPLVLNLHGYASFAAQQEFYGDFRPIADTANFLIVHPNGTINNLGERFWNVLGGLSAVDDVAFLSNLIDSLRAAYNIDSNRIYSTGMSNGGFMSYSLACELSDKIAAIGSVTGSMITPKLNACNPQRPVPVMEIHGTADNTVPYNGSVSLGTVAIPTLVNAWVQKNQCNPTPVITPVPDINTADGCTAEHYLYTGGINGSTVEHYKVIGGGHTWPGQLFPIGVTNQDFSASKEIWRFFSQYRLDVLTNANETEVSQAEWSVFPNPVNDRLSLRSNDGKQARQIRIFDTLGRLRLSLPAMSEQIDIETGTWESGIYFLLIEQESRVVRSTFTKL